LSKAAETRQGPPAAQATPGALRYAPPPMDEVERRVREDIRRFGWHVVKVMGDEHGPGWAYTIGLLERFEHPELAVFGLDLDTMHELLNHAAALVGTGRRFEAGRDYGGVLEGLPCAIRTVDPRWTDVFFGNAAWHYERPDPPLLQCFWPDAAGRFPWQEGFDAGLGALQPRLFEPEVGSALSEAFAGVLRREGALE